jgi:Holliday junction resolvase
MTNYTSGARIEYKAMHELEKEGYLVIRAAGSHGAFDLVALGRNRVRLIQCKKTNSRKKDISRAYMKDIKQMEDARNGRELPICTMELWVWRKNGKRWEVL